jgi:hypothetical protein
VYFLKRGESMAIVEDKYMTYDYDLHAYNFSNELIKDKLNENLAVKLNGDVEANIFREDVRDFIKDYIVDYGVSYSKKEARQQIEWLIAQDLDNERYAIQRAYVEFCRYAFQDEGDMLGLQTGLNVVKGQIVDISKLRGDAELSSRLYRVLKNSKLLFKGQRMWYVPNDAVYGTDY